VSAGPRATRATGGRDDQLPDPHTLTLDECDAIDIAKGRIRRLASLLADLLKNKREYGHHEDSEPAMADLLDVILQDVEPSTSHSPRPISDACCEKHPPVGNERRGWLARSGS
jgi:hypothetical protein